MKTSHMLIGAAVVTVVGYFLWRRYQDVQRAKAHPITIQSNAQLLKPLPINPALVTDAQVIV